MGYPPAQRRGREGIVGGGDLEVGDVKKYFNLI